MSGKPRKTSSGGPKSRAKPRDSYHHGNLRKALIEAAMEVVLDGGTDALNMREAARRAGVSPGAPFRHFDSRDELMLGVAEEAFRLFRVSIEQAIAEAPAGDALKRFRAIAVGYLRWAIRNPAYFEILSTRRLFDLNKAKGLRMENDELIMAAEQSLADALPQACPHGEVRLVTTTGRAMLYGFARMQIDGHFPRWRVDKKKAERVGIEMIDQFIEKFVIEKRR